MTDLIQNLAKSGGSVECLGMTFPSEDARRDHFRNLLAEKLKDPAFRAQEGFPRGTDEAILAMSDPPYYTACPNPWLAEFVTHYGRPYDAAEKYAREPMAIDVSARRIPTIPRCRTWPSCRRSCITPSRGISCWMASPVRG
jgi:hypothetical protein